jgi:hypothetical protein
LLKRYPDRFSKSLLAKTAELPQALEPAANMQIGLDGLTRTIR